jgi:hypothetical protein
MSKVICNSPWIESPFFENELESSSLSEDDKAFVRSFAENGYIIIDPQIDLKIIDSMNEALEPDFNSRNTSRIQDAWSYNERVKEIAVAPYVLDRLRLLYGREPIPFQTLNFSVGTQQRTHSDMIHFNSIPQRFMCGVWTALEDVNEDNGPLHYFAKSHKLPFYEMVDMGVRGSKSKQMKNEYMDYSDYYENFIGELVEKLKLKKDILRIKKGQSLIWAANLLHGGEKINTIGSTRKSQVTHYFFEDCTYYTPLFSDFGIQRVYVRDIKNIRTGKHVENKYLGEIIEVKKPVSFRKKLLGLVPNSFKSMVKKGLGK